MISTIADAQTAKFAEIRRSVRSLYRARIEEEQRIMTQRKPIETTKQLPLRLDPELYEELNRRATIENKSMSDIVREALRARFDAVRITKPQLHAAIERIAREDAEILEVLGRGPQENMNGAPDRLRRRR